jgi:ABC transporter DrrB family efflux protein
MNFFASFTSVLVKEFLHIRRDPFTLVITIVIPVFQLMVFGYAIDMDVKDIPTVVYDCDRSAASREFLASMSNTRYFDIKGYVLSDHELKESIVAGRARVGIKVPPDFSANMMGRRRTAVQLVIDGSDSTVGAQAANIANAIGLWQSMNRGGRVTMETMPLEVRSRTLFNPDLKSANFFVPGLVGLIMQVVSVFLTSFAIVRERERGNLEQLLVTPLSRSGFMLGKLIPYGAVAFGEICIVLTIMRYVFGVHIAGNLMLLLAMCFLFLFTGLGLGILVSTIAQNQAQAMQMAFLIMLPSVMLSGFVFPRESMPTIIYYITFVIPLTYFIEILRGIIIRGAGIEAIWNEAVILAFYGFAVLTLSTLRFRRKLL